MLFAIFIHLTFMVFFSMECRPVGNLNLCVGLLSLRGSEHALGANVEIFDCDFRALNSAIDAQLQWITSDAGTLMYVFNLIFFLILRFFFSLFFFSVRFRLLAIVDTYGSSLFFLLYLIVTRSLRDAIRPGTDESSAACLTTHYLALGANVQVSCALST